MAGKTHQKNGFEFFCERFYFGVLWYFRPVGAALWAHFTTTPEPAKRADLERVLKDSVEARRYYDAYMARASDVSAAEARLAEVRKDYEYYQRPDFDPGPSDRTNPGAVARELRNAAQAREAVERAESNLKQAHQYLETLQAGNRA